MKVFVQVVNTTNGLSQNGMIEEPVQKGYEIDNALKHFGVNIGHVNWQSIYESDNFEFKFGKIQDTTKIVSVIAILENS